MIGGRRRGWCLRNREQRAELPGLGMSQGVYGELLKKTLPGPLAGDREYNCQFEPDGPNFITLALY
ncbi:hypothetical protein GKODMF_12375 [Candidatus Electrothrix gigas]